MTAHFDWTDERLATLRGLWCQTDPQLTTNQIADRMGISKNAIVGKAHREGLPGRPSPIKRDGVLSEKSTARALRRRTQRPRETIPVVASLAVPVEVKPEPVTVFRPLSAAPCCFPLGDPGTKSFRFCDEPSVVGKPYCGEHCDIAYVKVSRSALSEGLAP